LPDPFETYLQDISSIRGIGTDETSGYPALSNLLNAIGKDLQPKVRCIIHPKNAQAGLPDGGFYLSNQLAKGNRLPVPGILPQRGAMEVKPTRESLAEIVSSDQVIRYREVYRQVLLTNYRQFLLVGYDSKGQPTVAEGYSIADTDAAFWKLCGRPRETTNVHSERLTEYLRRAMLRTAPLADPRAVAFFLASYARDARSRLEDAPNLESLAFVRVALEDALGVKFEGKKGEHFFRSTLVQTLFYGIFAAWVLWHKADSCRQDRFNWHEAQWSLHVPMIRALYEQIASPGRLGSLNLTEILDQTGDALSRVDRPSFFRSFDDGHSVQYFYEPFLQAFDPELRKQLGVWYTPPEVVRYMVSRVHSALQTEMGIPAGLADPRVYVLDPCCGTGAYLVEVLRCIEKWLVSNDDDGLIPQRVKRAARERVFGFEIMPAPFVIAHLQLGLHLRSIRAALADDTERAAVYLTNALTGWEPPTGPKEQMALLEMQIEKDAADQVKQQDPVLVIIGNPPYNGFAGVAVNEERDLSNAYRVTRRTPAPQGQGLNDLYVRFFRMAERKIVEKTGRGIVCFVSNYSWLDGLSFTGMRERYVGVFNEIWLDCLNGDKYKTGKSTPDGEPDPSIFSTEANPDGIQVGTSISLLVRDKQPRRPAIVHFRHLWGKAKRERLDADAAQVTTPGGYATIRPVMSLGLPFVSLSVDADYIKWPLLTDILPTYSPGVNTSRDADLVQIKLEDLRERMECYFDPALSDEEVARKLPSVMTSTARYDCTATRKSLLRSGISTGFFVPYAYRPFDTRWVYWHAKTKLLDEKREELFRYSRLGTRFLTTRQKSEREEEGTPFYATPALPDRHLTRPGSICIPLIAPAGGMFTSDSDAEPIVYNLSIAAVQYLSGLGLAADADGWLLWHHCIAIGFSTAYLTDNADAIRMCWPRVPLPAESVVLRHSAELGRRLSDLLDPDTPVSGVTSGPINQQIRHLATLRHDEAKTIDPASGDLEITAGWGHMGRDGIAMPGSGKLLERNGDFVPGLGTSVVDVYLNNQVCWSSIPKRVWEFRIGGYQVIKKWLSYRDGSILRQRHEDAEHTKPEALLQRSLSIDEVGYVTQMARRIAAIILLEPELDANYLAVRDHSVPLPTQ